MSKMLVISDLHLSDEFNSTLYSKLVALLNSVDKVILNGDFWDDSKTNFDKFINSQWNRIFPLLKKRDTVYIFGNHDPAYKCDSRVNLFSIQQLEEFFFNHDGDNYYVTHGQNFSKVTKFLMLLTRRIPILYFVFGQVLRLLMAIAENSVKKNYPFPLLNLLNSQFKNKVDDAILIMGHTHVPEIDLLRGYINSGFNRHGFMSYLILEDGTAPTLHKQLISSS